MSAVVDTWEGFALADRRLHLDALLCVKALARLATEDGEVSVTIRSLSDACGKRDAGGRPLPTAQRGVKRLLALGYLARSNPEAPRRERAKYVLTIPAVTVFGT